MLKGNTGVKHTLEKTQKKCREDKTGNVKEMGKEQGNPNRLSARQELPLLTLPSAKESRGGGGERDPPGC